MTAHDWDVIREGTNIDLLADLIGLGFERLA